MGEMSRRLVVGITGASGAIYADRLIRRVAAVYDVVHVIVSEQALQVFSTELGRTVSRSSLSCKNLFGCDLPTVSFVDERNFFSPPASGSYRNDGMVIVPCSMGTLGRIANGISNDLLTRAADVAMKERRKLILVPREMPLNLIMIRNMAAVTEAGGVVLPAMPAWYQKPATIEELADTVVARILQQLGIGHDLMPEWMA